MAEYIERETIKAKMIHYGFKSPDMTVTEFVEDELPAADVAPVQHGRWEWDTEDVYRCTACYEKVHAKEVMGRPDWNYCPNCGAKMDGDGNG